MNGPGKYDDLCTFVRIQTGAHAVIVIVQGGDKGGGFSMQAIDPAFVAAVPEVLEAVAAQIRQDAQQQQRQQDTQT